MKRVFVSYSRRNKNFAERLARDLSDAGLEVWVDWRQIQGGELWQEEIYRGIERSEILVICLSPASVTSEWCQREVNTAHSQGKYVIPVMAVNAMNELQQAEVLRWLLDVHIINFENRYEEAFPELLEALPGARRIGTYDVFDPASIPNPFKGLEAFQQTDAQFFFGREEFIAKSLARMKATRFLAVVGASGSGKSSIVRAGVIPAVREGALPGSDRWPVVIFTPGDKPVDALAQRLSPLLETLETAETYTFLRQGPGKLIELVGRVLQGEPSEVRLLLVIDQFEEIFTRAGETEREMFLKLLHETAVHPDGRAQLIITMRADFFDRLGRYPDLAHLFEQENLVIVTEMTAANLLRAIEGPAQAVGLEYEQGLAQRILDEVRRQPGSLPLLQYALKTLYERREGRKLTNAAYDAIGGVRRALARHAEDIYAGLNAAQQSIMKRVLLRLIEVSESGEATRRRVDRDDLSFKDVPDEVIQEVIDLLTAAHSRLLISSRQILASDDEKAAPRVTVEISHEALIREWERFTGWVTANAESLRLGSELLQAASDWQQSGRDAAYLLTGNRLVRAEDWLESADATALQRELIRASVEERERHEAAQRKQAERELAYQRAAARRLRYFVAVLIVSLVVAIGLSLFALDSLSEANAQRERANEALLQAEANEQEAVSLALSTGANGALRDGVTDLALMLSVAANQVSSSPPPQSQRTLAEIAYAPGTRRLFNGHVTPLVGAALRPDGRTALSADDTVVILWQTHTGIELDRFSAADAGVIATIALSPDGLTAALATDQGIIVLWEVDSGTELRRLNTDGSGHAGRINHLRFSPDGTALVSSGSDNRLALWDIADGSLMRTFEGHTDDVTAAAFNADGSQIVSGSLDRTARIWNVADGQILLTLSAESAVNAVDFSRTKTNVITGAENGLLTVWNSNTGDTIGQINDFTGRVINVLSFSADGNRAIVGLSDGTLALVNLVTAQVTLRLTGHLGPVRAVLFSANEQHVLSASQDATARFWDITRADSSQVFIGHNTSFQLRRVAGVFGPGGATVLSGSYDRTMRLWNVETGLMVQELRGSHTNRINAVAMSADGTTALSASSDSTVILWDIVSGAPLRTLQGHTGAVNTVIYLPGDLRAVSGDANGGLIVWNLETGEIIHRLGPGGTDVAGHTGEVLAAAVSADGNLVVSASADETLILWNAETGTFMSQITGHKSPVRAVAFSPDGRWIVSGSDNGALILWDAATGSDERRFNGHTGAITGVDFSPDGAHVASGSLDRTIRVWNVADGFEIRRFTADDAVQNIDFSPDGRSVVTGLGNATLRTWRVLINLRDLIDWTYVNRHVRVASCDEREVFGIDPQCGADDVAPAVTPYPLPTATPFPPGARFLQIGGTATINTDSGDTLRLRAGPGISFDSIRALADGDVVTLLEGPVMADGFTWWRVRIEDGAEGWVVESVPLDRVQTLLP